jgi:hypothetical protein
MSTWFFPTKPRTVKEGMMRTLGSLLIDNAWYGTAPMSGAEPEG